MLEYRVGCTLTNTEYAISFEVKKYKFVVFFEWNCGNGRIAKLERNINLK